VEGDHEYFSEWYMCGRVPIRKHETLDVFLLNLEAWVGKPQHWYVSQRGLDLTFNDPTSLMALLF
jgi:hypothetical protein